MDLPDLNNPVRDQLSVLADVLNLADQAGVEIVAATIDPHSLQVHVAKSPGGAPVHLLAARLGPVRRLLHGAQHQYLSAYTAHDGCEVVVQGLLETGIDCIHCASLERAS